MKPHRNRWAMLVVVALVATAATGGPADNAGLQPGDVIIQVNRREVHNTAEYQQALASGSDANHLLLLVNHQGQNLFVALNRSE